MVKSLEERVRCLEDVKKIKELMHKYCATLWMRETGILGVLQFLPTSLNI